MMASLLEKVQTLIAADLNRLVDRALESNEPAVFQHHIREMQELQQQLNDQLVSVRAELTELRRRSDEEQALVVKQDAEVDQLLQAGLQEDALAAQDRLNQNRLIAARLTEQLDKLEARYAEMVEAQAGINARVSTLQESAPEFDSLVGLARAKELTAETMQSLDDLSARPGSAVGPNGIAGTGERAAGTGDPDAARLVSSIRTRLAEAEAQIQELQQRALAHGETPEVLKRKELEAQLEERKARLGL
jgi:phage shock protein A